MTGNEWQGISSDGVDAVFEAELSQVADGTPTFDAPSAKLEKGQAYLEASIEVLEDWRNAPTELGRLLQDAKDRCEAQAFLTGTGTNEPEGLLTALDAAGNPTVISHNGIDTDIVYVVRGDLPSRYQPNSSWLAHPTSYDAIRRLVGPGSDELPVVTNENPLAVLRRPAVEMSTMAVTSFGAGFAGDDLLVFGDFTQLIILDKIASRIELVPTVLGSNRRPIGARGFYLWFRSTVKVLNANAFRVLQQVS